MKPLIYLVLCSLVVSPKGSQANSSCDALLATQTNLADSVNAEKKLNELIRLILDDGAVRARMLSEIYGQLDTPDRIRHDFVAEFRELTNKASVGEIKIEPKLKTRVLKFLAKTNQDAAQKQPAYSGYLREYLLALLMAKSLLSESELKQTIREAAQGLAHDFSIDPYVGGLPLAKGFQFAKNIIRKYLGLSYESLSDVLIQKVDHTTVGMLNIKVLSIDPVAGTTQQTKASGLYSEFIFSEQIKREDRPGKKLGSGIQEWQIGTDRFKVRYKAHLGDSVDDYRNQNGFDYRSMKNDGRLTGLIFPASNMGSGEAGAIEVLDQYYFYFKAKGFQFSKETAIGNFPEWLGEKVSNAEVDYVIKEAHADGMSQGLGRVNQKGKLLVGRKASNGGHDEVVYLFFPDLDSPKQRLAFSMGRNWMKTREKDSNAQLVWIDTSCHSNADIHDATVALGSELFAGIGSMALVDTFTNEKSHEVYKLLSGFRAAESFSDLQEKAPSFQLVKDRQNAEDLAWKNRIESTVVEVEVFKNGVLLGEDVEVIDALKKPRPKQ